MKIFKKILLLIMLLLFLRITNVQAIQLITARYTFVVDEYGLVTQFWIGDGVNPQKQWLDYATIFAAINQGAPIQLSSANLIDANPPVNPPVPGGYFWPELVDGGYNIFSCGLFCCV